MKNGLLLLILLFHLIACSNQDQIEKELQLKKEEQIQKLRQERKLDEIINRIYLHEFIKRENRLTWSKDDEKIQHWKDSINFDSILRANTLEYDDEKK